MRRDQSIWSNNQQVQRAIMVLWMCAPIAERILRRCGVVTMRVLRFAMRAVYSKSFFLRACERVGSCGTKHKSISLKLHNAQRPLSMKTNVIKKRQRGADSQQNAPSSSSFSSSTGAKRASKRSRKEKDLESSSASSSPQHQTTFVS